MRQLKWISWFLVAMFYAVTALSIIDGQYVLAGFSFLLYLFAWFVKVFVSLDDAERRMYMLQDAMYELDLYFYCWIAGIEDKHFHGTMFVGNLVDALYFWKREKCIDCGKYDCDDPNCLPF